MVMQSILFTFACFSGCPVASIERPDSAEYLIFGKLSESEWARRGCLHTDRHLRQFGA